MALSYVQYGGTGSLTSFGVPFQYLAREHVFVSVNGTPVSFTWLTANQLSVVPAPASGSVIEVRRKTTNTNILADFSDGSTLTESDLDTAALQNFLLAQESLDRAESSLSIQADGTFSAATRRLTNVADPVNDKDAVTKAWAETSMSSALAQAIAAKDAVEAVMTNAGDLQDSAVAQVAAGLIQVSAAKVQALTDIATEKSSALTGLQAVAGEVATDRAVVEPLAAQVASDRAAIEPLVAQIADDRGAVQAARNEVVGIQDALAETAAFAEGQAVLAEAARAAAVPAAATATAKAAEALTSALIAQDIAVGNFPRDFANGKSHLTFSVSGSPASLAGFDTGNALLDDASGKRLQFLGQSAVLSKGVRRLIAGKVYRVSATMKQTTPPSSGTSSVAFRLYGLLEDFSSPSEALTASTPVSLAPAEGMKTFSALFSDVADPALGILAWPAGRSWGRPYLVVFGGAGAPVTEMWESLQFDDVTSVIEAQRALRSVIATKPSQAYVDAAVSGIGQSVAPVTVVATTNIVLSGLQTIDGVSLVAGNAVLCVNQSGSPGSANNGIWTVASGAWTRRGDSNSWDNIRSKRTYVTAGTAHAGKTFSNTNVAGGTLGATAITYVQSDASQVLTGGTAIQVSGNQISFAGNKATVGLDQADNTSDANKPVSGPQQAALDGKEDALPFYTTTLTRRIGPVPGTAHYTSLQAAVNALAPFARKMPTIRIVLLIEEDYPLPGGLVVAYGDYGNFEIKSENNKLVKLASNWVGVTANTFNGLGIGPQASDGRNRQSNNLILGHHARMPVLGCLIDMGGKGDNGYMGYQSCQGLVRYGCGVINAGHDGCNMHASHVFADQSIWNGANNHCIRLAFQSSGSFQEAIACFGCLDPDEPNQSSVDVSRQSHIHARLIYAKFTGRNDTTPAANRPGGASHSKGAYTAGGRVTSTHGGSTTLMANLSNAFGMRRGSVACLQEADFSGAAGDSRVTSGNANGIGAVIIEHACSCTLNGAKIMDTVSGIPLIAQLMANVEANGVNLSGGAHARSARVNVATIQLEGAINRNGGALAPSDVLTGSGTGTQVFTAFDSPTGGGTRTTPPGYGQIYMGG